MAPGKDLKTRIREYQSRKYDDKGQTNCFALLEADYERVFCRTTRRSYLRKKETQKRSVARPEENG